MASFASITDIHAWRSAKELSLGCYALTGQTPVSQDFGLRDQLRRAAVSIMSNIAEGFGRGGDREFLRFLNIARGSAAEVGSLLHLIIALHQHLAHQAQDLLDLTDKTILLIARLTDYLTRSLKDFE
jgi:four helix bundle protein